jgi:hypothetical protein
MLLSLMHISSTPFPLPHHMFFLEFRAYLF